MNTSSFKKYLAGGGTNGVSIALTSMKGFHGPKYPKLFPRWAYISEYKRTGDTQVYTRCYNTYILSKLDPEKVWEDLKDCTLLCWELSGGPSGKFFCHRRLVATWLEKALGVVVPEI